MPPIPSSDQGLHTGLHLSRSLANPCAFRWSAARRLMGVFFAWPARSMLRNAARLCGAPQAFRSADRCMLEDVILRRYAERPAPERMLFVGTRWYTRRYERLLPGHCFLSMDIDPRAARHGSRQGHVTDCASRAQSRFEPRSFDVIVFNGVFGWGLDERAAVEAAVRGFHHLLREGGELVVGWNDVARRRPFAFGEVEALQAYERFAFEPAGPLVLDVPGPNRHRFEFFRKPLGTRGDSRPCSECGACTCLAEV